MTPNRIKAIIQSMETDKSWVCYKLSILLLTITILLLLFLIVVTGAEDWVFTLLGYLVLFFSISSISLFFINKNRQ